MGQDRLSAAFTEMMREDGKADALLDQAMDKFEARCMRGLIALSFFMWAGAGGPLLDRAVDKFEARCLRLHGSAPEAVLGLLGTCRRAGSAPAGCQPNARHAPPRAPPQDQVCYGMYNQASVHQYRAEALLWGAARSGAHADTVAAAAEEHLKARARGCRRMAAGRMAACMYASAHRNRLQWPPCLPWPTVPSSHASPCVFSFFSRAQKAEAQLDAALAYKAAFLDGYLGRSALAQLRAKVAANYLLAPVK